MKGLVVRWVVNALALILVTKFINGIVVDGVGAALMAAFVLGVVNAIIRPIILLFTLPLNLLTLGLFTVVINGLMLELVASFVKGFQINGLLTAIVASILLSVFSGIMSFLIKD